MSSQIDRTFSKYNVAILASSTSLGSNLSEIISKRGATTQTYDQLEDLSQAIQDHHIDILICHEQGFDHDGIAELVQQARAAKPSPIIIWSIGEAIVPLADGFTPLSFKPSELLRPIFFSLLIHEDLHASS